MPVAAWNSSAVMDCACTIFVPMYASMLFFLLTPSTVGHQPFGCSRAFPSRRSVPKELPDLLERGDRLRQSPRLTDGLEELFLGRGEGPPLGALALQGQEDGVRPDGAAHESRMRRPVR